MANKDDLSVNINVGVNLDQSSVTKAKDELQFLLELQKELGVEGSKIRVGGYSTSESPDRTVRNKAASKIEAMGGDWSGVDIADKASVELAKRFNEAAQELSKAFKIDFMPDFAASIGEADFALPKDSMAGDKITQAIEDFVMNAAGEVTVSPAMFMAAAEKVMKNNPGLAVPRGMDTVSGIIKPTAAFGNVAKYDEKLSTEFMDFISKAVGDNPATVTKVSEFLTSKLKVLMSGIIDDAQKAREDVFKSLGVAEGDDTAENVVRYADDAARRAVAMGEQMRGLQAGTTAVYGPGLLPEKFQPKPGAISDPQQLLNVLIGEYSDEVTGAIMAAVPDPAKVARPIAQILMNPYILGDKFASGYETEITKAITKRSSGSGAARQTRTSPENQKNIDEIKALIKAYQELNPIEEQAIDNSVKRAKISEYSGPTQKSELMQQEIDYNQMRIDANKENLKIAQNPEEIQVRKNRIADLEKEIELLKEKRDIQLKKESTPTVAVSPATPRGGGALNPNIDLLRNYLTEQKAAVEDKGRTLMAGLDTEFNYALDEKLTELGLVIEDGTGKFVEIFKFLQLPNDLQAMYEGSEKHPPGSARNAKDLLERGQLLGIPKEQIGIPEDAEANFLQYREKIAKLVDVLNLLSELGISLTGSNFASAEASNITKAIDFINNRSAGMGLDPLATPDLSSVFDPVALAKQLAPASPQLAKIFDSPEMQNGISGALNNLIKNIASEFPEFFARYSKQFNMAEGGKTFEYQAAGGKAEAHYALTDAAASVIVADFVKEFGRDAVTLLEPIAKDLNKKVQAASGGSGGTKGPGTPTAAADKPGDDPMANRAAASLQRLLLVGAKYEQAIGGLTEVEIAKVEKRLKLLQSSKEQVELLAQIADLEKKRSEILAEAAQLSAESSSFGRARQTMGSAGPRGPLTQGDAAAAKRYEQQTIAATRLGTAIRELEIAGEKRERQVISTVKEESRSKDVSEALVQNMRKEIDAIYEKARAGGDATAQIKNQMQEQVNAQKAVQRQTQSLMNTWVTSRYALYDIGNFYQNVSQNLIRASRAIFDTTRAYRTFETSFTSVERAMELTQEGAVDLRNQFIRLSETIPVSFEEISRIATLGAQMGITADGIIGFTDTVAKFASITGISAETVAQQFGKIAELADVDPSQFNNLGSAVAFAGVNAVATESEILTLSQSIAAVSNQVGITAPEIVGLGTALASVGIPAEQARGVFTRVFADIDRSASLGGKSLQALSEITGLSADKISSSWGEEGAANEVFVALLRGLDASDNLTAAFDKLNIVETREINTLTRLAKNMDVVMQALDDAGMSFESATFLTDSFDKTADNLDSKLTLLRTNFDSLTASLMSSFGPVLGTVVDGLSSVFRFLKGAEDSILFRAVLPLTGAAIALGAVFAATAAAGAKLTAQLYAFRVAQINAANAPTAVDGTIKQVKALLGLNSGLIEVRNNVAGINERGLVEPVNFDGLFTKQEKHQKQLLKEKNLYYALGEQVKETAVAKEAGAVSGVQLARLEADLVNKAIAQQQNKIVVEQKILDDLASARTAAVSSGLKDQALLLDAEMATQAQRIEGLKTQQVYLTFYKGEAQVVRESTLRAYERIAASRFATEATKAEAAARLGNATAINLETRAASQAFTSLAGKITGFLGVAGLIATIIPTIFALGDAIANMNKIDLTEAGGGLESLREAIKKDTLAVKDGTMVAVATAEVQYKRYTKTTDSAATAIRELTGLSNDAAFTVNKVTEEFKKQSVAIGENTKEWIANALYKALEDEDIDFSSMQKSMAELGLDFDQVIRDMVAAANGADVNPLENVEAQLDSLRKRRDELNRQALQAGPNNVPQAIKDELTQIYSQIGAYEDLEKVLASVGVAFEKAFSKSAVWNAIKSALGLEGVENNITKLIDRYKKVAEAGKSLKPVMNDIKTAVKGMLSEADRTNEALNFDIDSASTIEGLIQIVSALIKTREAAAATSTALANVGTSAFYTAAGRAALDAAAGTTELKEILASLQAVAAGAAVDLDGLGGAAESAADRIARLISEANAGVVGIMNFREAIRALGKSMAENKGFNLNTAAGATNTQAILSVLDSIGTRAGNSTNKAINNMKVFKLVLQDMGAPQAAIKLVNNAIRALGGVISITAKQAAKLRKQFAALFSTFQTNFAAGASEAVEQVEKKVRTLTDYVNDLRGILQSAFDFRYAKTIAIDAIANSWEAIGESAKSAQKAIQSANAEINEAVANRAVLEYQLAVAERYGDEKRAAVIRAKLAKLDQEIIDKQEQLAEATAQADTSLTGNTKAAINNRAKIRDLVTQYNAYLIALANSGASSETLQSEAAKLEQEFLAQGIAMGFAENELDDYTQAFKGDFTTVVNNLPRDITVNVNTDPALRAIEEFVAKAKEALSGISNPVDVAIPEDPATGGGNFNGARPGPENDGTFIGQIGPQGNFIWDGVKWVSRKKANRAVPPAGPENPGKYVGDIGPKGNYIWDGGYWLKRARGGMIYGPGGPKGDKIPTLLSSGEFVVRAGAVKTYGPDFMNALNQQRVSFSPARPSANFNGSSGSSMVYLSPEDRALLRAAVDRPIALYTENTKIAQSANAGNMILAQRGSN